MKIKNKAFDLKELEYTMLMSFELRVLKVNHMENIILLYNKFCGRMGLQQDEALVNNLDKQFLEASNCIHSGLFGGISSAEEDSKLLEDPVLLSCPNVTNVDHKAIEEGKENIVPGMKSGEKKKQSEKEDCIVCMEKIREIVFIPCCHFLTCGDCSQKIGKCPLCSKRVEKNLKIFWS